MVQIALADDIDLALKGAQTLLEHYGAFEVVGTYDNPFALFRGLGHIAPGVLLISDKLHPEWDPVTLVQRVHEIVPTTKVILLSTTASGALIHQLFVCGLAGYLYRGDVLSEHLIEAIQAVLRGRPYLSPTANAEYLIAMQSGRADWQPDDEAREVLRLFADGYRPQEIALMRGVPVRRIYWVGNKLRRRFNAETNEHLIVRAVEEGFLP